MPGSQFIPHGEVTGAAAVPDVQAHRFLLHGELRLAETGVRDVPEGVVPAVRAAATGARSGVVAEPIEGALTGQALRTPVSYPQAEAQLGCRDELGRGEREAKGSDGWRREPRGGLGTGDAHKASLVPDGRGGLPERLERAVIDHIGEPSLGEARERRPRRGGVGSGGRRRPCAAGRKAIGREGAAAVTNARAAGGVAGVAVRSVVVTAPGV